MAKSLSGGSFVVGKPKRTSQGSGKHSRPKKGKSLTVAKAPDNLFSHDQKLIASTAVAMASVLGSPASEAGEIYVNPEYNAGFSGAEFVASSLELHAGFQEGPFYIQAGPALSNDGSDSEWGFSGKTEFRLL